MRVRGKPTCHPDRQLKGHGLCNACYKRTFQNKQMAKCHPDRPHEARGLCARCYEAERLTEPGVRERIQRNRRALYQKNPERFKAAVKSCRLRNYSSSMVNAARSRARKRGLEFSLTAADIAVPDTCPLLGIPIFVGEQRHKDNSPTLDRIRNDAGYTPDNVWVISYRANRIKNDSTVEEFLAIADGLKRRLGL